MAKKRRDRQDRHGRADSQPATAPERTARDIEGARPEEIGSRNTLPDTPEVRGMIKSVQHLVRVREG